MLSPAHQAAITEGKGYRILRANVSETLASFKVNMPQWTLLGQLYDTPDIHLADLANYLGVEAPLITSLVKELDEKGLLTLKVDPSDNRAKLLSLTEEGRGLIPAIEYCVNRNLAPLMKGISVGLVRAYFKVLEGVIQNDAALKL